MACKAGIVMVFLMAAAGCGDNGFGNKMNSGGGENPVTKNLCTTSCPHSCKVDNDCHQAGQLCCDFGSGSHACVKPEACPVFCTDDSKCNTSKGQVCCQANLGSSQKVCVAAASCPKKCGSNSECGGATPKCCTNYGQPICTTVEQCPSQCSTSTECNTGKGQTCCSASVIKAAVKGSSAALAANVKGLCSLALSCPKQCSTSQDCDTTAGQLCCNGICATSCAKSCTVDNDCETENGQLCCTNQALYSPWYGWTPPPPPQTCKSGCGSNSDCLGGKVCCDYYNDGCSGCSGYCTSSWNCSHPTCGG